MLKSIRISSFLYIEKIVRVSGPTCPNIGHHKILWDLCESFLSGSTYDKYILTKSTFPARIHCASKPTRTAVNPRSNTRCYPRCFNPTFSLSTLRRRHHRFRVGVCISIPIPNRFPIQLHQQHQVHHNRKGTTTERVNENYGTAIVHALDSLVHQMHAVPGCHHFNSHCYVQNSINQGIGSLDELELVDYLAVLLPLCYGRCDLQLYVFDIFQQSEHSKYYRRYYVVRPVDTLQSNQPKR